MGYRKWAVVNGRPKKTPNIWRVCREKMRIEPFARICYENVFCFWAIFNVRQVKFVLKFAPNVFRLLFRFSPIERAKNRPNEIKNRFVNWISFTHSRKEEVLSLISLKLSNLVPKIELSELLHFLFDFWRAKNENVRAFRFFLFHSKKTLVCLVCV